MTFGSENAFREFDQSVRQAYRFARTRQQSEFLDEVCRSSSDKAKVLRREQHLYRAQLGYGWRREEVAPGVFDDFPSAHEEARMIPDASRVGDGRVNARGIACLYLSTKQATAALEVRPLIGSHISIAVFEIKRDLKIVDCSEALIGPFARLSRGDWSEENIGRQVWTDINNAFSAPVERSDAGLTYVPTQIIAETLRLEGFDGIAYKSGYGEDGYNVALFDVTAAKLIMCGLHRVAQMSVELSAADNPYYVTEDGVYRNKITAVYPVTETDNDEEGEQK